MQQIINHYDDYDDDYDDEDDDFKDNDIILSEIQLLF